MARSSAAIAELRSLNDARDAVRRIPPARDSAVNAAYDLRLHPLEMRGPRAVLTPVVPSARLTTAILAAEPRRAPPSRAEPTVAAPSPAVPMRAAMATRRVLR